MNWACLLWTTSKRNKHRRRLSQASAASDIELKEPNSVQQKERRYFRAVLQYSYQRRVIFVPFSLSLFSSLYRLSQSNYFSFAFFFLILLSVMINLCSNHAISIRLSILTPLSATLFRSSVFFFLRFCFYNFFYLYDVYSRQQKLTGCICQETNSPLAPLPLSVTSQRALF